MDMDFYHEPSLDARKNVRRTLSAPAVNQDINGAAFSVEDRGLLVCPCENDSFV
jgi:hypothetical protein